MELDVMKRLIKKYISGHADYVAKCNVAERYYLNKTDILYQEKKEDENGNPMRNADNRIPRNFHGLIVNQKAAYAFTAPPLFDVGTKASNEKIAEALGDEYKKNCMELCVNAANFRTGWIHYWKGEAGFEWAVVDSREIIPVMSKNLKKKLMGVFRTYEDIDEETGDHYVIYEYWTDTECQRHRYSLPGPDRPVCYDAVIILYRAVRHPPGKNLLLLSGKRLKLESLRLYEHAAVLL